MVSRGAVRLTAFAAIVLMLAGFSQVMLGMVALINGPFFVAGQDRVLALDVTTWGWVHLLLGAGLCVSGFGLFAGAVWARTVGVVVAALSAVALFAWLPTYPVWSMVLIALAVGVIWALTVHGRDIMD